MQIKSFFLWKRRQETELAGTGSCFNENVALLKLFQMSSLCVVLSNSFAGFFKTVPPLPNHSRAEITEKTFPVCFSIMAKLLRVEMLDGFVLSVPQPSIYF